MGTGCGKEIRNVTGQTSRSFRKQPGIKRQFELTHLIVPVHIHGIYFLLLSVLLLRVDIACLGSRILIIAVLVLNFFAKMRSVSRLRCDLGRGREPENRESALTFAAGY
jgi:hypothetical protein